MILITGSTGYIGSHLSKYILNKKLKYIGVDNLSYSYKTNIKDINNHFFFDISNKKKMVEIIKKFEIKTVIHTAASSYVLEAEKKKKDYYINNVVKTIKFIDICKKNNVKRFIFLSSSNVYKEPKKNKTFSVRSKTVPKNYYGKTKLIIEKYLKKKKFDELVILRLFNIVGMFNKNFKIFNFKKENYQRLIFKLNQNTISGKTTTINYILKSSKKNFPSRDFVNIKDLAYIIFKILNIIISKKKNFRIFNVCSGISTPIDKVISIYEKKLKKKFKIKYIEISKKELEYTKGSNIELYNYINYRPKKKLNIV